MKSFDQRLRSDTEEWVREGILSAEQRTQILQRYDHRPADTTRSLGVVAMVGGALFVVGVSLVIKANWQVIPDWTKIGGLVLLLIGSYVAGWRLKVHPGAFPKSGDAFFMAGAVFFLLGIALVSQIFHLNSRPPNGVLLWWAGIVALPWLVRATGMQFVSVIAGLTWLFLELAADDSWIRLVAGGSHRGDEITSYGGAVFLVGLSVFGFGAMLRQTRHEGFAGLHERIGLLMASAGLYLVGLLWTTRGWMPHHPEPARGAVIALLVGLAAGSLLVAWRRRGIESRALGWGMLTGFVPVLAILLGANLGDGTWLFGGLACVALFVLNLGMVRAGAVSGRESWINLGILGIAANVLTRYFLLFGTMLEGGVFFIVTGLIVLGLGLYLEHQRRRLVRVAREEVTS